MRILPVPTAVTLNGKAVTFDQGLPMLYEVLFIPVRAIAADAALYLLAGALPILVGLGGFSLRSLRKVAGDLPLAQSA